MTVRNPSSGLPTGFVPVPEDVARLRGGYVVSMGPPPGVSDQECATIWVLRETAGHVGRPIGRGQFAYYRPTAEELAELNAGGVIELGQFGEVFQAVSLRTWPLSGGAPNQASGLSGLHEEPHPRAGETMRVRWALVPPDVNEEAPFRLEDWWDRVSGQRWGMSQGNPAAIVYGLRSGLGGLPYDDEVVYGKVGRFGYLVHASELRETVETGS